MSDFPEQAELDDYYEKQFQDEFELMRQSDHAPSRTSVEKESNPSRRSLDFSCPLSPAAEVDGVGNKRTRPVETDVEQLGGKRHKPDSWWAEEVTPTGRANILDEHALLEIRILEARRRRNVDASCPARKPADTYTLHHLTDDLSYSIPKWAFISVTREDGQRMYVRLVAEEGMGEGLGDLDGWRRDLEARLHSVYADTWPEANRLLESKRVSPEVEFEAPGIQGDGAQLLVERYRPRHYTELLSEESDNRAVLHWLKLWDKVVFNREVKTKEVPKPTSFSKRAGGWVSGVRGGETPQMEEGELDGAGRPRKRVLLLAGPPGAGKTTLAHLLASHAGYRPLEVNASDERTVEAFRTVLHNATEMQATLDRHRRPNCIILDEIDGAPQPTVEWLVRFVTGTGSGGGKARSHHFPRRPIICICNDLWSPALRPLRAVAAGVSVGGVSRARVATRLSEVAVREGLRLEGGALAALTARTGGDVRAGLAALHLLSARVGRGAREVRSADVERLVPAHRDTREGLVQVLRQLLAPGPTSRQLARAVSALGEYDRLAAGMQENLVAVASGMAGAARALDALRWLDRLQTHIAGSQQYALYPHLAPALLAARRLLPVRQTRTTHLHTRIAFPTRDIEVRRETERAAAVGTAVRRGAAARLLPFLSRDALTFDLLPLLPHLIAPNLHSHNIQLYSAAQRGELGAAARVMCDYALQYEQIKAADNTYHYTLQPDILRVAFYDEVGGRVRQLGYAVQQTLAREVQLEMMRRAELKVQPTQRTRSTPAGQVEEVAQASEGSKTQSPLPNHLQRLHAKPLNPAAASKPHVARDMFGRAVANTAAEARAGGGVGAAAGAGCSLIYQYREGYNNAVRRSVKLRDLL